MRFGQTIGIVGGGQLGRMLILEGHKMGYRFVTLDPASDAPAGQVANEHIVGSWDDLSVAGHLAEKADLLVYEFENVSPAFIEELAKRKPVPQGSKLLEITRHRAKEKDTLARHGLPVTPYYVIQTKNDLYTAMEKIGFPAILKTATGGYDGKGQWKIDSYADGKRLISELDFPKQTYVLEKFVPFVKELSVVVARSIHGEVMAFPPSVNLHRRHILHMSLVPAPVPSDVVDRATELASQVAERLEVVGLIAVEMFLLEDGSLYINELAPRPHNSGHYTLDACNVSQFEQMIRAVVGLPLVPPRLHQAAIMVNILGEHKSKLEEHFYALGPSVKIHWYGKTEAKVGRKMGHLTVLADTLEEALEKVEAIPIWPSLSQQEREMIFQQGVAKR